MDLPKPTKSPRSKRKHARYLKADQGMQLIGRGAFASVYGRPNERRVVKIGETWDRYLKFVKRIGLHSDNPHFPKLHNVQINRHEGNDYYVIEMEKLIKWGNVPKDVRDRALAKFGVNNIYDLGYTRLKNIVGEAARDAIRTIRKVWYTGGSRDMHRGNVMFRKKGKGFQLVLIDPAA